MRTPISGSSLSRSGTRQARSEYRGPVTPVAVEVPQAIFARERRGDDFDAVLGQQGDALVGSDAAAVARPAVTRQEKYPHGVFEARADPIVRRISSAAAFPLRIESSIE